MGDERAGLFFEALALVLKEYGWSDCVADGTGVSATHSSGRARFLLFGADASDDDPDRADERLRVMVHDDAIRSPERRPETFQSHEEILALAQAGASAVVHTRLGWDLLFRLGGRAEALEPYRRSLLAEVRDRSRHLDEPWGALVRSEADRRVVVEFPLRGYSVADGAGARTLTERNALIAFDDCVSGRDGSGRVAIEQYDFLWHYFVSSHFAALQNGLGIEACTVLPILINADAVRSDALQELIDRSLRLAIGRSFGPELAALLARLGFLHLYVAYAERLRVDVDLDPNTSLVSEILHRFRDDGRFTLCCAREYVLRPGIAVSAEALEADEHWTFAGVTTIGQRFSLDTALCLIDMGEASPDDHRMLVAAAANMMAREAESVAKLSGGRLLAAEAERTIEALAFADLAAGFGVLQQTDLRHACLVSLTGNRQRPAHVAAAMEATVQAPFFARFSGGRFSFRDKIVRDFCIARAIERSFARIRRSRDLGEAEALLDVPGISRSAILKIFLLGGDEGVRNEEVLRLLLRQFGLFGGSPPHRRDQAANLIVMILVAVDHWASGPAGEPRQASLDRLLGGPIVVKGLSLPQLYFAGLSLNDFSFENCNLRACAFARCNLRNVRFTDCFLGGATFKDCEVSNFTVFAQSELAGAWLSVSGPDAAADAAASCARTASGVEAFLTEEFEVDRLLASNWTGVLIRDPALEEDMIDRAFDLFERDWANSTELSIVGKGGLQRRGAAPELLTITLQESARGERLVAMPGAAAGLGLVGFDDRRLHRPAGEPVLTRIMNRIDVEGRVKEGLVALDVEGGVFLKRSSSSPEWFRFADLRRAQPPARLAMSDAIDGRSAFLAVSYAEQEDGAAGRIPLVAIIEIPAWDAAGRVAASPVEWIAAGDEASAAEGAPAPGITTMTWYAATAGERPLLCCGYADGRLRTIGWSQDAGQEEGGWIVQEPVPPSGSRIADLTTSSREQVILLAHDQGLLTGYRLIAGFPAVRLFRIQTALQHILAAFNLPGLGLNDQFMVVGALPEQAGSDSGIVSGLCVILTPAGNVLAVFEREERIGDAQLLEATHPQSDSLSDVDLDAELKRLMNAYEPLRRMLDIRPLLDDRFELVLARGISTSGEMWDEDIATEGIRLLVGTFELARRTIFRQVSVAITPYDARGAPILDEIQSYTEAQLDVVDRGNEIVVRCPVSFSRRTLRATISLNVFCSISDGERVEKSWPIDVAISWRENPYETTGRPALGKQFHGRADLRLELADHLAKGRSAVLRGARRMGKTSLLSAIADDLMEAGHLALDISLIGIENPASAMVDLLAMKIRDRASAAIAERIVESLLEAKPSGSDIFRTLAELASVYQFKLPVVLLIDEWGAVANSGSEYYDRSMIFGFGELIYNQKSAVEESSSSEIALCLSGTPRDFFVSSDMDATSDPYRAIGLWYDVGPLTDIELRMLMREPLKLRGFEFEEEDACFERLRDLSTGDAHAANVVMSIVYERAMDAGVDKIGSALFAGEALENALRDLYMIHKPYTFDRLDAANRIRFATEATRSPPPWEREPPEFGQGGGDMDGRQWGVFGDAGFRSVARGGRFGDFRLWIPRGMSLAFERSVSADKGGNDVQ